MPLGCSKHSAQKNDDNIEMDNLICRNVFYLHMNMNTRYLIALCADVYEYFCIYTAIYCFVYKINLNIGRRPRDLG